MITRISNFLSKGNLYGGRSFGYRHGSTTDFSDAVVVLTLTEVLAYNISQTCFSANGVNRPNISDKMLLTEKMWSNFVLLIML